MMGAAYRPTGRGISPDLRASIEAQLKAHRALRALSVHKVMRAERSNQPFSTLVQWRMATRRKANRRRNPLGTKCDYVITAEGERFAALLFGAGE